MIALRPALKDVAELGPFFAVTADPAEQVDPTWRACHELYTDPEVLRWRVRLVADALGTDDRRVAASIAFQGLAARLVSPVLAVSAVHGVLPCWSPRTLHWRPAVSGPWPLWESAADPRATEDPSGEPGRLAGRLVEALVEPHLAGLVAATRSVAPVSARVLWGNAASALASAAGLIARARPAAAGRVAALVGPVLATGPLADAGRFERPWAYRRRSCCLYYRVPGGGTCGDCVLDRRGRRDAPGD